jgi:transcriptional regulator with XRE-family HTH domain
MLSNTTLGDRIANGRIAKSYSEQQLAQRLGVDAATVEKWESGENKPRASRIDQLSGVLNVPLTWLMAGTDSQVAVAVDAPNFAETKIIEEKLEKASQLVNELSFLLAELQGQARRVQRDIDVE